jgi:hypothetical protein
LAELARGPVKIAACFPRAVRWLFAAAQAPLVPDQAQVLNMRVQSVDEIVSALLDEPLQPNVDSPSAAPPAEAADARPSDPTSTSTPLPSAP